MLQIISALTIAWLVWQGEAVPRSRAERALWVLLGSWAGLMLVQLVPLPPQLWSIVPGRELVAKGFLMEGKELPWLPVSVDAERTIRSLLGLLPPAAMLLMISAFERRTAHFVLWALFGLIVLSALMGLAQLAGGSLSFLYLYDVTNRGSAVGFFANSNHLGSFMVASLPLLAAMGVQERNAERGTRQPLLWLLLPSVAVLALLGATMSGSLAALLLAMVALAGSMVILFPHLSRRAGWIMIGVTGVLAMAVLGIALFSPIITDLGTTSISGEDRGMTRSYMWQVTALAVHAFGLLGAGWGSFDRVFPLFEDRDLVTLQYANHAHNDLLEWMLEGGVPAIALLVAFLIWFGRRCWLAWTSERDPLAQGAAVAMLIVLLHSLVDYPLRTSAMATLFALLCALVARPPRDAVAAVARSSTPGRHLSA